MKNSGKLEMMAVQDVIILHGGELSSDIASRLEAKISVQLGKDRVKLLRMSSSREVKSILEAPPTTLAVFVAQTIENEAPPEDAGACVRFFKRRTHPADLLAGKFQFAVLGLGDSNLLLDRQHTAAKDCNQVAQALDRRLEDVGGVRYCNRGEADERTGLLEVEPWMDELLDKIKVA